VHAPGRWTGTGAGLYGPPPVRAARATGHASAARQEPTHVPSPRPPRAVNPPHLAPPIGFSHGVVSEGGRVLWLAGQNGTDAAGAITAPGDLVAQVDQALANVIEVVREAGGAAGDIVKLHFYVSDVAAYRAERAALGAVWRRHFGRTYPAMMLLGVTGFYDEAALVEIDGYAVLSAASGGDLESAGPDEAAG
jgi:enamine deaminase RidA (YjgF/YER057c/UK114 family)